MSAHSAFIAARLLKAAADVAPRAPERVSLAGGLVALYVPGPRPTPLHRPSRSRSVRADRGAAHLTPWGPRDGTPAPLTRAA